MKTKSLLKLWLFAIMLCSSIGVNAHDFVVNNIYYKVTSINELTIAVTYKGSSWISCLDEYTDYVKIPQSVFYNGKTYYVTSIEDHAFHNCKGLTSITIPNSVVAIGEGAFTNCVNLTSIKIPDSVISIGKNAFKGTAWEAEQPRGIIYAGKVAYEYKGTMPKNAEVILKDGTLGIAGGAFSGCKKLISITIPQGVVTIGAEAFCDCNAMTSVTVGNEENPNIKENIFVSLREVMRKAPEEYKKAPKKTEIRALIDTEAFKNCTALASVTIPPNIAFIASAAFSGCNVLTSVIVENEKAPTINEKSFDNRTNITLTVPRDCKKKYENAEYWKEFKEIIEKVSDDTSKDMVLKSEADMVKKEHEYVDLGLPSGTLWATTNIGAENPEDVGGYFAWGETICNKENYSWVTYKWYGKVWRYDNVYENNKFTKYCDDWNYGNPDNLLELELCDDAAYTLWGSEWRIPSYDDYAELFYKEYTILEEGELNGKPVYQIKSKINGNTIYLPMGGTLVSGTYSSPTDPNYLTAGEPFNSDKGWSGNYWTRNLGRKKNGLAYCLILRTRKQTQYAGLECIPESRFVGCNIRPVRVKNS